MSEKAIQLLESINQSLEDIKNEKNLPKLLYAKDIAENYNINKNTATKFCKKYGTKFGGYCIEAEKFRQVLQDASIDILS